MHPDLKGRSKTLCIHRWHNSQKLLQLINEFSIVVGFKINTRISAVFLYTCNEQPKNEIKNTIPFLKESSKMKYVVINLTKELQELYTEIYKALLKEIKEDLNKWKGILCSCTGKFNFLMMAVLPKLTYRFNTITIIMPTVFFAEMDNLIWKFIWKCYGHRIAKTIVKKKNKAGGLILSVPELTTKRL